MGMFSWVCKGCGYELCESEHVLLDGVPQEYDGYGGSAAAQSNYEPVAWHLSCYNVASIDEKKCTKPSDRAPNQGFGPPKLEFKLHASLKSPTTYEVDIDCGWEDEVVGRYHRREFVLTEDGQLGLIDEYGRHPTNRAVFASLDAAIEAADKLLPDAIPTECKGEYELFVTGRQSDAYGCVYHRYVHRPVTWKGNDYTIAEELRTDVLYDLREREARIRKKPEKPKGINKVKLEAGDRLLTWQDVFTRVVELSGKHPDTLAATPIADIERVWELCLHSVIHELELLAKKSPANLRGVREFPWTCGECGKETVRSMRLRTDGSGTYDCPCDNCGTVWN